MQRAPRIAHRRIGQSVEDVPVEELGIGDRVAVRAGEVIPADGLVFAGEAVVDESALTGEPLPVTYHAGQPVRSGTANVGDPFEIRIVRSAAESAYGAIVRLVRGAQTLSAHALAQSLVRGAERRGQALAFPEHVEEQPGSGIEGVVEGHRVAVGSRRWMRARGYDGAFDELLDENGADTGKSRVLVGVDGALSGAIVLADRPRAEADPLAATLQRAGVRHLAMVTGDRSAVAERIGAALGIERVYAEQSPEEKLEVVRALKANPELAPVLMVGDGINDAPALALADVGIAMGVDGATVASETADAVIVVDRIDRVAEAVKIGRRSLLIALQSVTIGLGLSLVAMAFAAFGFLPPVGGALLQEAIDVGVIVNALRALQTGSV